MSSATRQANFLLPEDLLDELRKTASGRQQSKVVAEALRKELKRLKLEKALQTSFGAWKDKDHPEMRREGTAAYLAKTRKSARTKRAK